MRDLPIVKTDDLFGNRITDGHRYIQILNRDYLCSSALICGFIAYRERFGEGLRP